jgi:hypothetical protein
LGGSDQGGAIFAYLELVRRFPRDIDAHNVSNEGKVFDKKGNRLGTYDKNLNRIKD